MFTAVRHRAKSQRKTKAEPGREAQVGQNALLEGPTKCSDNFEEEEFNSAWECVFTYFSLHVGGCADGPMISLSFSF